MQKRTPPHTLEHELAEARRLLAAGRRQEALAVALNLLQDTLGSLRSNLLALQRHLAQAKDALAGTPAAQEDNPPPPYQKTGGPYLH
jgi:hypothetical protein